MNELTPRSHAQWMRLPRLQLHDVALRVGIQEPQQAPYKEILVDWIIEATEGGEG